MPAINKEKHKNDSNYQLGKEVNKKRILGIFNHGKINKSIILKTHIYQLVK